MLVLTAMVWLYLRKQPSAGWLRWFGLLAAGLLISILLSAVVVSNYTSAADATWKDQGLVYNGNSYIALTDEEHIRNMGLNPSGHIYALIKKTGSTEEMQAIYFPPDTNMATASSAELISYDLTRPNTYSRKSSQTISVEPAGEHSETTTSKCGIADIGWVVCPVTTFLARGMDWLYDVLSGFLETQPLNVSDTKGGLRQAWNIMLSFANAVFIIMFLVIIYSQVTSFGISNYGIKKMLPRLIISALLVNISYYICALAIDLSNIAGHGFQDMFIQIRNALATTGQAANSGKIFSAEGIASIVLSGAAAGGAIAAGGYLALVATGGAAGAAIILLLPILLGAALTLLVVLLVLAARQALIVILTIISPLAFVCYLLPGTEKWFEKWRETFLTMLIFFPAFSAIFGGSQLAAMVILQNSTTIVMVILGLAVQIAPLALAPLILKLSGGLLNRFAGIINNPNKGLIDRTRNFAREAGEGWANRRSLGKKDGELKKWSVSRRLGRAANYRKRARQEKLENLKSSAERSYMGSRLHADTDRVKRSLDVDRQTIEKGLDKDWSIYRRYNTDAMNKDLELRRITDEAKRKELALENRYIEAQAGHVPDYGANSDTEHIVRNIQVNAVKMAAEGMRQNNANRVKNNQQAEYMLKNDELQKLASGIYGDLGVDAAIASAITTMRQEYGKSVQEGAEIIKHFKLSSDQLQKHVRGEEFTARDDHGNMRTFKSNNLFTREAAIEDRLAYGTVEQVAEITALSGSSLAEFRGTISSSLAKSSIKSKAPFLGGKLVDEVIQGNIRSHNDLLKYIESWVVKGKFKPEELAPMDVQGAQLLTEVVEANLNNSITSRVKHELKNKINEALSSPVLSGRIAENTQRELQQLRNRL